MVIEWWHGKKVHVGVDVTQEVKLVKRIKMVYVINSWGVCNERPQVGLK